jgi:DNA-binding NarL/FixJ family response regulator
MEQLQIFLADDHVVVREGLKALINAQPDMVVVGEAGDGKSAWQQVRDCRPDVVIMDITMPELNGVQATAQLKRACPDIKVLALSVHEDTSYLRQLLAAGASGYILKHAAADDLIQAIRVVAAGGVYLDPALAGHVVARYVQVPGGASALEGTELSERETEVFALIGAGLTNTEIADALHISLSTVKTHLASLMAKLGARNRVEIAMWAYETRRILPGT